MTGVVMMLLASGDGPIVSPLAGGSLTDVAGSPTNAQCEWRFNPDGTVDVLRPNSGNLLNQQQWYSPTGGTPGTGFWIRMTPTSGTFNLGDTTGAWLQMNVARVFGRLRTSDAAGTDVATGTVEIASDSGGANIVTSGVFTARAQVI